MEGINVEVEESVAEENLAVGIDVEVEENAAEGIDVEVKENAAEENGAKKST